MKPITVFLTLLCSMRVNAKCEITAYWEFQDHKYKNISELGKAAAEDDVEAMEEAFDNGCDVNYNSTQFYYRYWNYQGGFTPLHIASTHGANEAVKKLISYKKSKEFLNKKDELGATAVYAASYWRYSQTVTILHKGGANLEITNQNGATPLYVAAQNGHLHAVKTLVSLGANIEKGMTIHGETPLYIAAERGYLAIVKHLSENGAKIDTIVGSGNYTPLITATVHGSAEVVQYLVSQCVDISVKDGDGKTGMTALERAIQGGNIAKIDILKAAEKNNKKKCQKGTFEEKILTKCPNTETWQFQNHTYKQISELGKAAAENDVGIINKLIKGGCDILYNTTRFKYRYQGYKTGFTPLHIASTHGSTEAASMLLRYENFFTNFIDTQDEFGATAAYAAAYHRFSTTVKVLYEAGADINIPNENGATPLYVASQNGHLHTVKILVKLGADINKALETNNQTPLMVAVYKGHTDIVKFLLYECAEMDTRHTTYIYSKRFNLTAFEWARDHADKEMYDILEEGSKKQLESCHNLVVEPENSEDIQPGKIYTSDGGKHSILAVCVTLFALLLVAGFAYLFYGFLKKKTKEIDDKVQLI